MDTYIVTASRDGKFWMLEIDGPGLRRPGATQVRRLDQAEAMARDWLMTRFDLLDSAAIRVVVDPVLPDASVSLVEKALAKRIEAMHAQRAAQEATTIAAKELSRQDLTVRDIGVVLDISHQRVSQMINAGEARTLEAGKGSTSSDVESGQAISTRRLRKEAKLRRIDA